MKSVSIICRCCTLVLAAVFSLSMVLPLRGADVRVGIILPLSGPLASFGRSTLDGIEQRVKEINQAGGVNGQKLKLIIEDNRGEKQQSVSSYQKLIGIDRVKVVVGPITSTNCLGVVRQTKRARIPLITPTATNDTVAPKSPYLFRACFNDSFQGRIIAQYALKTLKIKKAAVMIDLGSDYSKGLAASFRRAFEAGGGKVVAKEKYQQKDTEFGAQLSTIRTSGAEIVFVPGYPPEVPLIVKQAGQMGVKATFCGADGWDNEAVIQNSSDKIIGSFIVGAFSKSDKRPVVQRFVKTMKGRAGTFEALGYDSVSLLAEALKNGTSARAIQKGLLKIRNLEGITGFISIKPNGDAVKSAVILSIQKENGNYVKKYLTTVSP